MSGNVCQPAAVHAAAAQVYENAGMWAVAAAEWQATLDDPALADADPLRTTYATRLALAIQMSQTFVTTAT